MIHMSRLKMATLHFDVVTDKNDTKKAISFAKEWLKSIGKESSKVTIKECKLSHTISSR